MKMADFVAVSEIIRKTAQEIILPKFEKPHELNIYQKGLGNLVTNADIEAEISLAESLCPLVEGSQFIGEESCEKNNSLINLISSPRPIWIVDPIDGTKNFINGSKYFAVMVAFRENNSTHAAWLYDPLKDFMISAKSDDGIFCDNKSLKLKKNKLPLSLTTGIMGKHLANRLKCLRENFDHQIPKQAPRLGSCGHGYLDLFSGKVQFVQYGTQLYPWDHTAGVFIAQEAGFHIAFLEDSSPYEPSSNTQTGHLLIATNKELWLVLRDMLWCD